MKIGRILFGLLLAGAVAVLAVRARLGVEADLLGLVSSDAAPILHALAQGTAARGKILLEGDDPAALQASADSLGAEYGERTALDFPAMLKYLETRKAGLLSAETRRLLLAGRFGEVAQAARARLFGFGSPLFSVKNDPFLLGTDFAMSLQSNLAPGWTIQGGYPVCQRDGRHYLLLSLDLSRVPPERLVSLIERARRIADDPAAPVKIWCTGPPCHSAWSAQHAKGEINVLSSVSVALVVLFGWLLFRSFRFVPHLLVALGVAGLVATAALFGVFGRPHVLTFVFGTSLIGLSVDYVYHACAAGGGRKIARPLTFSFLTTAACFVPLLFADLSVLRQMALFTGAGLATVYAYVLLFCEGTAIAVPPCTPRRIPFPVFLALSVLFLATAVGMHRMRIVSGATFYRPDAFLAAGERKLVELNTADASCVVFVRGATLQEALEREEAEGLKGLSAVIPSLARQRENAAFVAKLVAAEGADHAAQTGLKMPESTAVGFLDAAQVDEPGLKRVVEAFRVEGGLVLPCPMGYVPRDPNVTVVYPRRTMEEMFGRFFRSTALLLGKSLCVLAVLLLLLFRRRVFRYAAPLMAAFAATAGLLGWLGIEITAFTLLCFFVLMGLGIDYVIFHNSYPSPETRRTVFFSFLTSLAGLGLLAFTAFPVTHAMGVTFAWGLAFSYLCAVLWAEPDNEPADVSRERSEAWHEQREQSAGRFRLLFMWYMYAWFGKSFLKVLCVPVMACIYPFARPARAALHEFYDVLAAFTGTRLPVTHIRLFRHLLGFAWSLADKTDACALKKNLPAMAVREDDGWRAFQALVTAGKGAFLMSTHVGTVEVLPALARFVGGRVPHVHAFQQMGHDAAFMNMFLRRFDASALTLHAVESIGVETAVLMQEAIGRGDLVLMAGDRVSAGSGKMLAHEFLGRPCHWPKGVFAFAKLMEAPVFFVICVRTGWNAYEVRVAQASAPDSTSRLLADYVAFLERETCAHPEQWYQFYRFFPKI